jgi:hypothetical protein
LSILTPPFRLFRPNMTFPLRICVPNIASRAFSGELSLYTREPAAGGPSLAVDQSS